MASNSFGQIFKITTFGESHGKAIGVVIDGCPAGIEIDILDIQKELDKRKPGLSQYTSPRKEPDQVKILSGVTEGLSTGAPIALLVENRDADSSKYENIKDIYRPGHANFSYLQKYGIFDHRGGGRASARETVVRVAAGAIAKKLIEPITIRAWVDEVGGEKDQEAIEHLLEEVIKDGDSVGACISCEIENLMPGLGDPIYEKLEMKLAAAMLSIPATKGIEFGNGFQSSKLRGSENNDLFEVNEGEKVSFTSNHHGGILAGISTGENIYFRVAFKPTSSIKIPQKSVNQMGEEVVFTLPEGSRHDPCVALRAPPIVESMAALVIADCFLISSCSKKPKYVGLVN